ncbi:MAG: 3-ketoacyl-ACP reductase [Clostridia bacterium]|nr:3-ketoacyl-ACP reductase [Clostridia bacterium]
MPTAMVTGGGRGIGLAIACRLAQEGYAVSVMDLNEPLEVPPSLTRGRPSDFLFVKGDITSAADRARYLTETIAALGDIQVLVNNAGVGPSIRADLMEMSEASWDRVLSVNLKAAMFLTQAVANRMLTQTPQGSKRGDIINIGSCSARTVSLNRGEYCVSKTGLSMLTQLFAARLAQDGIYVNEVRPGVIKTDMTAAVKQKYDALIEGGTFPVARWGTPEDVADAVMSFVGERCLYTTGSYIDVDGGFHIRRL